jgi:magnesium chelatase family protein
LLDRIDLQIEVPALPASALGEPVPAGEPSAAVRERVARARNRQRQRQRCANAQLQGGMLDEHAALDGPGRALLRQAMERLGLSARGYHRVLRVARTIADLAGSERIDTAHLTEAIGYRRLDRSTP